MDIPGYAIDDMNQYGGFEGVETVHAAAALNEEAGEMTVSVINADPEEDREVTLDARAFEGWKFMEHIEMYAEREDDEDTFENPQAILPRRNLSAREEKGTVTAVLRRESWNVLQFGTAQV